MSHYPLLVGPTCYLSPYAPEDAALYTRWVNDLEVTVPLGGEAHDVTTLSRMQADMDQAARSGEPIFTIVDRATDQAIGRCMLFAINTTGRSAMLGIFIGDKTCWGRGYGQEALRLLIEFAFLLRNLHSLMLGVFEYNTRAIHAYEKVGFRLIGRRRQAHFIGGKAYDVLLMDLLASEYTPQFLTSALP